MTGRRAPDARRAAGRVRRRGGAAGRDPAPDGAWLRGGRRLHAPSRRGAGRGAAIAAPAPELVRLPRRAGHGAAGAGRAVVLQCLELSLARGRPAGVRAAGLRPHHVRVRRAVRLLRRVLRPVLPDRAAPPASSAVRRRGVRARLARPVFPGGRRPGSALRPGRHRTAAGGHRAVAGGPLREAAVKRGWWVGAVAVLVSASGCDTGLPSPDFERMLDQQKARPYRAESALPEGMVLQPPPAGPAPYRAQADRRLRLEHPARKTGRDASGADLAEVPLPVTPALLERGRHHFEILCAACHGLQGDGLSEVARHMDERKPPSLIDGRVRGFAAGRIFRVIGEGYGLLPSYARALQLSQAVALSSLPPPLRREAEAGLP